MYYRNVKIERDRMTLVTKLVPSHEIPVLKKVFDPESVVEASGFIVNDRPYGSFEDEYQRLIGVYGYEAVHAAYPKVADMVEQIPLLARLVTFAVRMTTLPSPKIEHADIPAPVNEAPSPGRFHSQGMFDAVNEALKQCETHNSERELFKNG